MAENIEPAPGVAAEEPLVTPGMNWFVLRVASNKEDSVRETLLRKIKIEIGIQDHRYQEAVDAITLGAYTGNIGDGKVFVLDMQECVRIRTAETGDNAVA